MRRKWIINTSFGGFQDYRKIKRKELKLKKKIKDQVVLTNIIYSFI